MIKNIVACGLPVFIDVEAAEDMHDLGESLAPFLNDGDVITLDGDLGAGKTQFSQGVGRGLNVASDILSPTFNLVFTYNDGRIPMHHFDLYRLEDALELEDIDFYSLVDPSTAGVSLIEWADKFPEEMPDDRLKIDIKLSEDGQTRRVRIDAEGASHPLLSQWIGSLL